jgi:hypothetical protein
MSKAGDWWQRHFLFLEGMVALSTGVTFGILVGRFPSARCTVEATMEGNRAAVYGALATIFGALLGFSITALSIAMTFSQDPRMQMIRDSKHYGTMWSVFTKSIGGLSLGTIIALVALVVDRDRHPRHIVLAAVVSATMFAGVRVARCIWLLEQLVRVIRAKR